MRYTVEERVYPGGLTCSGHPLACASAEREEGMIEHARRLGTEVIGPALAELADKHPSVARCAASWVFWALELVRDRTTREPLVPYNATGAEPRR